MKRFISILLVVLLSLSLCITAAAAELTSCAVTVTSVSGTPADTVTVAVSIGENPGFTNFAIALDYDPKCLTLKHIETVSDSASNLCGVHVSLNTQWETVEGKTLGYVVAAASEPVRGNGILFTATFEIAAGFVGETQIRPQVRYIRNNEAVFSIFEEIHATDTAGTVTSVLIGDVNGDSIVEYDDVMLAYKAFLGEAELTETQMTMVDTNRNGIVEEAEYKTIYQIYIGG